MPQTPFVRPGNTLCHALLSVGLESILETPDTETIDILHETSSPPCRARGESQPFLLLGACGSHTVMRFGCKTNYKRSRCHAVTMKRWVFACWSSAFLPLTANGLTTGFRKLYLKEMKNTIARIEAAFNRESCSSEVIPFFFLEAEQCLLTGCKLLQGKKCLSSEMIFTDGLAHEEFCSFTVLIRCSQLERSVWCKCFSATGAHLLETSPRPSDSLNTISGLSRVDDRGLSGWGVPEDNNCYTTSWAWTCMANPHAGKVLYIDAKSWHNFPPGVFSLTEAWTSRSDDAAHVNTILLF